MSVRVIRLAEALAALSLATDAGNGQPLEKSLRNAVIAARFGEALGLRGADHSDVYYTALLRSIGCTAYAHETAALLGGDDVAFHTLYERLDPGHPRGVRARRRDRDGRVGIAGDPRPLGSAVLHRRARSNGRAAGARHAR